MNFNSMKQVVKNTIDTLTFSTTDSNEKLVNKILTGVLLENALENITAVDSSKFNNTSSLASSYATTYKNIVESLKGKYVSYKSIYLKIISYNIDDFILITKHQLNEILNLYRNKTQLVGFDNISFSQYMYGVLKASEKDVNRLRNIHYKVIVPLINYCQNKYFILFSAVSLEDVGNIVGTEITIGIDGVASNKIYNDICNDYMNISKYLYSSSLTSNGLVKIIVK